MAGRLPLQNPLTWISSFRRAWTPCRCLVCPAAGAADVQSYFRL